MTWEEWIYSEYNLIDAVKESSNATSSRIAEGGLCSMLADEATYEIIYSDEVIDFTKTYYFEEVSSCK